MNRIWQLVDFLRICVSAKAMLTPFVLNETNATLYLYLLNEYSIPVIKIKFVFVFVFLPVLCLSCWFAE